MKTQTYVEFLNESNERIENEIIKNMVMVKECVCNIEHNYHISYNADRLKILADNIYKLSEEINDNKNEMKTYKNYDNMKAFLKYACDIILER